MGIFRNHLRGGANFVFQKMCHHLRTYFQLRPISNVKFGSMVGGPWSNVSPPPNLPLTKTSFSLKSYRLIVLVWNCLMVLREFTATRSVSVEARFLAHRGESRASFRSSWEVTHVKDLELALALKVKERFAKAFITRETKWMQKQCHS